MNKKDLLKTLDTGSYFSLIVASVLVIIFEMIGSKSVMKFSVILYAAAFLMLCVLCVIKLIAVCKKKDVSQESAETEVALDENKDKKAWLIVRLVFSAICFAFMLVFLVMY